MATKQISVQYIAEKPTQSGKQRWSVKDDKDQWYSVWELSVANKIKKGATITATVETKGDFSNITGVSENIVQPISDAGDDFFDFPSDIPVAPIQVPTPASIGKSLHDELRLTIEERMSAYTNAVTLASTGQIKVHDIAAHADLALAYYRQSAIGIEQKSSSTTSDVERFIK